MSDRISISANKASFSPKERITLRLQTTDASSQPVKANLSVAVVDAGIVPESKGNIVSYIHLQSEIRGTIEKPEQYFDPKNPERSKQLDLLLMTQGWRDFVWKRLRDTTLTISHLNETGFTISGQVKDKSGSKPLAGVMVTLFANGAKDQKLFGTSTNQLGKYYFDNINLEGNQTIKLVSSDIKAKKTGTLFLDSLYTKPLPVIQSVVSQAFPAKLAVFKSESALRWEERKKLNLSDTIQLNEVAIKAGSKDVNLRSGRVVSFGYPDQNFIITEKDDKDYQSLRHYLLTNVQGASPDTGANNGVVFTAARTISGYSYVHPTFIVDRNEDLFERMDYYELSMKDIERIIVRHMIGNNASIIDSASGMSTSPSMRDVYLIYLTLKPSAFSKKEPSLLNTSVNGYYQQRRFYEPRYVWNQPSSARDVRTTIHWQPYIKTDQNGEALINYYNADPKSKIRVIVEGITEKGVPVAGDWLYEVK